MKTKLLLLLPIFLGFGLLGFISSKKNYPETKRVLTHEDGCVFMTVMGEQSFEDYSVFKNNENLNLSVNDGLSWLTEAQLPNGGYGAGSHAHQEIMDPHAVPADPATTAMVGMAFLRSGNTLVKGKYSNNLGNALNYLLETVENTSKDNPYITDVRGTQIQTKLGQNIDAVLTAQFLSNMLHQYLKASEKKRIERALDICISKIEAATDAEGKQQGAGWAGVLQSGLASTALESASAMGANVDKSVLDKTRNYQKGNYDEKTNKVKTDDGAGVMLYAVSGSVRATAKDARRAEERINKAKKEGMLSENAPVTAENLMKAGYSEAEAAEYSTSYNVYQSAKNTAQQEDVLNGFGNNGGEEFLSFLQTGESLVVNKDKDWKKWYDDMSGRILKIQNTDGSWNGHHCITSPVFCTATSILLLTVENDIDYLRKVGE
ncbi:MAG: hypothetical protein KDC78_08485 [Aequorivita sp.]|nr:hypothetical protein [Aequorivita sp.]